MTAAFLAAVLAAAALWVFLPSGPRGNAGLRRSEGASGPAASRAGQRRESADVALLLELSASLLAAGQPVPGVLTHLAETVPGCADLRRVARALELSVPWERAWEGAPVPFRPLAQALGFTHRSGAAAATLLRTTAAEQRRSAVRRAEKEAAALAVRLVVPLGVCALPAFVCIGIVPLVVSLLPDM
ncbi:type II secretion system F family protein [Zhihengliuella halotolerans]|uniref:type II secretion system F family protein n=1 Tax=Zhihengliuella halotolerans TaxID=370736 RepID=UPI0015E0B218|nr:type II secretion system F family protein [Zhihengliuella halotolerans]